MIYITNGKKIVQRSRNLRGLIARAGKIGVRRAAVHRSPPIGAVCYVEFNDGTYCHPTFADFSIAREFFRKRWQKWGLYAEVRNSDDDWSFI